MHTYDEMTDTTITIGIPTRNASLVIAECLDCVLNQTYQDFQLLISDNGSTDNTVEICEAYAKKDSRIKVFKQETNLGMKQNFSFLLEKTETELFCWRADDDITSDTWLALLLAEFAKYEDIVVAFSDINYSFDGINADLNREINFPKDPIASLRKMFIEPHIPGYCNSIFGLSKLERTQAKRDSERLKCGFYGLWKTQYLKDTSSRLLPKYETDILHATDFLLIFGVVLDGTFSFIKERAFTKRSLSNKISYNANYGYRSKYTVRSKYRKLGIEFMREEIGRRNYDSKQLKEFEKSIKQLCNAQVSLGGYVKLAKWWLLERLFLLLESTRN